MKIFVTILITLAILGAKGNIMQQERHTRSVYGSHTPVSAVIGHEPLAHHPPSTSVHPSQLVSTSHSRVSIRHPTPVAVKHHPSVVTHGPIAYKPVIAHPLFASHNAHAYIHRR